MRFMGSSRSWVQRFPQFFERESANVERMNPERHEPLNPMNPEPHEP
jgi:hypothetical protein